MAGPESRYQSFLCRLYKREVSLGFVGESDGAAKTGRGEGPDYILAAQFSSVSRAGSASCIAC